MEAEESGPSGEPSALPQHHSRQQRAPEEEEQHQQHGAEKDEKEQHWQPQIAETQQKQIIETELEEEEHKSAAAKGAQQPTKRWAMLIPCSHAPSCFMQFELCTSKSGQACTSIFMHSQRCKARHDLTDWSKFQQTGYL